MILELLIPTETGQLSKIFLHVTGSITFIL